MAMELEESEIINLAVNIFQNVGIKRYIGDIEALRHEDIYFEIYKIIFPDSMINIFKISESTLTTGQKIQKIIEEISSIIKLDLYHISGECIAEGNINHITNWLQLLEALSNNFIGQNYQSAGGSAPDRDQYIEREFSEDGYHTVIGMDGEFDNAGYEEDSISETESSMVYCPAIPPLPHNPKYTDQPSYSKEEEEEEENSQNFQILKPVKSTSKKNGGVRKTKKKVTFNLDAGQKSAKKKYNMEKKNRSSLKSTLKSTGINIYSGTTSQSGKRVRNQKSHRNDRKKDYIMYQKHSVYQRNGTQEQIQQKSYINKMHQIIEQLERKNIYHKNIQFQNWAYRANQNSNLERARIEKQNKGRNNLINMKIVERQQMLESLEGEEMAAVKIKQLFRDQRRTQKKIARMQQAHKAQQMKQLLEVNFAAEVQNLILQAFVE